MSIQILGKQEREVKCYWGGFPCKKGHTVEEQHYCEDGGGNGILDKFCEPKFSSKVEFCDNGRRFGYQKMENEEKDFCKAVDVCDENGNDPVWTDEVDVGCIHYKFCQSGEFGIIYEENAKDCQKK